MKSRFLMMFGVSFLAASVLAASAAADPPTRDEFSPVGAQVACGDTIITVTGGRWWCASMCASCAPAAFA